MKVGIQDPSAGVNIHTVAAVSVPGKLSVTATVAASASRETSPASSS